MEFRKTKLIGLDRKGNTNVGEIVKLAKSIALSNYEKVNCKRYFRILMG